MIFVDGLGLGDAKDVVLRDRRQLSADGVLIVVAQLHRTNGDEFPEVIARGFAPEGQVADEVLLEARRAAADVLSRLDGDDGREHKLVQTHLHDAIAELIWERCRKRPLIMPVVVDV